MAFVSPEEQRPGFEPGQLGAEARQVRLANTLRVVQIIAQQSGSKLPVDSVEEPYSIPHTPGVYLLGGHLGTEDPIIDADFHFKKKLLSGAADSAHSVVSGDLTLYSKGGRPTRTAQVAAKCFSKRSPEERFKRAIREISIMEDLKGCNQLSFEPIALAIAEDVGPTSGEIILLTLQEDGLLSLDNQPWGRGPTNPRNYEIALLGAKMLGKFNGELGYFHGDAKIKNCAVKEGEGAGMIDYETTQEFTRFNPIEASSTSYADFGQFIDSLGKKGFLPLTEVNAGGRTTVASQQIIATTKYALEELAIAYLGGWNDAPIEVQEAVYQQVNEVIAQYFEATLGSFS